MTMLDFKVFIVDDDAGLLRALGRLVSAHGYRVETFLTPFEFLKNHRSSEPGCAVIDVSMPELGGLELQERLIEIGAQRPIIFITGKGDIPTSVRAMKAGAVDFLTKPVGEKELLDAIERAIQIDRRLRDANEELCKIQAKLATLTPRERQVFSHVVAGRLNKQIAGSLGTVEKTIKVHRGRMMDKLGVRTVADLVRLAEKAGVEKSS